MAGEEQRTRVRYEVLADFADLSRKAAKARREIKELRDEEAAANRDAVRGSDRVEKARNREAAATRRTTQATKEATKAVQEATSAQKGHNTETERAERATDRAALATGRHVGEMSRLNKVYESVIRWANRHNVETERSVNTTRRHIREQERLGRTFNTVTGQARNFQKALDKLGDWRPRLIPPFIALVPIIAAILALINPLVAGLGAVGAAAAGLAVNLSSVAGAALAAVPALATLLSLVAALKIGFGGVGNVFKQYSAMKAVAGGGGGGSRAKEELTQAEELERAQEKYRRSVENVKWAEDDLDEARKDYLKRLRDLQKAVDRAALSEARAAANAQLARENYANILADPGSTKGQKMAGAADVDEAKNDLQDVQDQNRENADELARMQREGIEGDRQVIQAKRALTDAIWAERDAYLDLRNTISGANRAASGGAGAANKFREALAKLSPSARAVVLSLIAMQAAWDSMKSTIQESFFSKIVGDVDRLRDLIPPLTDMLSDTAGAAGEVASKFLRMITSTEWMEDFRNLGKQNIPIIRNMGDALLSVLTALKDLTFAAGPFAILLTESLAKGAQNLADLVASARESGRLATWLDTVYGRLQQWWRIIKNIGRTLFNYGAAMGGFGQWMTDALERMTERWVQASESAREVGSPFQQFLEDIKPLLTEISGMFGDFFRWFAETSANPDNIEGFTNIVKMIREDLGPALGEMLQTLASSGMGEDFVGALTSILEAIDIFLKNGGLEGMGAFWSTVEKLFDVLQNIIEVTPEPVLTLLASTFGTLAALRFFGLNTMLGLLLKVAGSGAVKSFLTGGLARLGLAGAAGTAGAGTAGAAGAAGAARAGGFTGFISRLFGRGGGTPAAAGAAGGGAAAGGGGFLSRLGGRLVRGGKGGLVSLIASLVVGTIADEVVSDGQGGNRDIAGTTLSSAATGAGIGTMIFPGVGTVVGTAAGGAYGAITGVANSDLTEEEKNARYQSGLRNLSVGLVPAIISMVTGQDMVGTITGKIGEVFGTVADAIGNWWQTEVVDRFSRVADNVGNWWQDNVIDPFTSAVDNISAWWYENVITPASAFFAMIGRAWNQLVVEPWGKVAENVSNWWNESVVTPLGEFAAGVAEAWDNYVVKPLGALGEILSFAWSEYVVKPFTTAAEFISTWWNTSVVPRFTAAADFISNWWNTSVVSRFSTVADNISNWWNTSVVSRFQTVASNIGTWWNDHIVAPFQGIVSGVASFVEKVRNFDLSDALTSFFNRQFQSSPARSFSKSTRSKNLGGLIHRAEGGGVPGTGNGDTVPAMLTPGEFVIRKAIVQRWGADTFARINSGVLSIASMFRNATARSLDYGGPHFFNQGGLVPHALAFAGGGEVPRTSLSESVFNNGITVENLNVNNPVAEPASDSLPRAIRKVAYLGGRRR